MYTIVQNSTEQLCRIVTRTETNKNTTQTQVLAVQF